MNTDAYPLRLFPLRPHVTPAFVVALAITLPFARSGLAHEEFFTKYPAWSSGQEEETWSVALGDVDSDGDLDFVCGNGGKNTLYVNDEGLLSKLPAWSSGQEDTTWSVALGDVDGDGDLDLVCGNYTRIRLYLNEGGLFATQPAWSSGQTNATASVALGDVDGDGDLDLVCGNYESSTLYLNEGGLFATQPAWSSGQMNTTKSVALGDVDGDGDLDLVCGNWRESSTLYLNEGGLFSPLPVWSSEQSRTRSVALGDVDGDGDLDLVCGNDGQSSTLYLNEGGLFATLPAWSSDYQFATYSVALGDVDGDGDLDLVCGNDGISNTLYLNEGAGFSTQPVWFAGGAHYANSVVLGDVDGDGDLDLVCGNWRQSATLYVNVGSLFPTRPAWSSEPSDFTNRTRSVALGDIDGDGDLDLVCGVNYGRNRLYLNEGGLFATQPAWSSGPGSTNSVALGDIDGDGDLDLVCGNNSGSSSLYLNEGGLFATSPAWAPEQQGMTRSVALGDVDGDGDLDLVCGKYGLSSTLYLNEGGLFATQPAWSSGQTNSTNSVALGDIDGDGDLDLVCGNYGESSTLYLNEGGHLTALPSWTCAQAYKTWSVALGDADGDGDLDLVCGNEDQSEMLYLNERGHFTTQPAWSSGPKDNTWSVALGDADGDGDLDLVCGTYGGPSRIYVNEGGIFATQPAWLSHYSDWTYSVALGDVDGDGDLDLVCGNSPISYGGAAALYPNYRNPVFKGDTAAPRRHLPNNSAYATVLSNAHADTNLYHVRARLFDVESDPVWLVVEYQFEGAPQWFPAIVGGKPLCIGPLSTSPEGVAHTIDWDVTMVPYDARGVILRLRVVSVPRRVSIMQHIASHTIRIGRIEPVRGELAVLTTSLTFPVVTLGDTASAAFSVWNRGTSPLQVTDLRPTSANTHIDHSAPFSLAPDAHVEMNLMFVALSLDSDPGALHIESDGLLTPLVIVDLDGVVRPLDFIVTNLYPDGEITQGEDLRVAAVMGDSIGADSARVFLRKGGGGAFWDTPLIQIADPANEQYVGGVPADSISSRGVDYYVKVFNGAASNESAIQRLRQRVTNASFPGTQPARSYRMISIPFEMEGTILGTLGDDLGALEEARWRMFGYEANNSRYVELPNDSLFAFEQGRAYWLVSNESSRLDTGPDEGLSTPTDGPFIIDLTPGWNIIGHPFNFAVAWDSIRVDLLSMAEAEGTVVEPAVRWQPGEGYRFDVEGLRPFEGYWVRNLSGSTVNLKIPAQEAESPSPPETPGAVAAGEVASKDDWRFEIRAATQGIEDGLNYVGVSETALSCWDSNDRCEPPMNPGRALSLYFPHTTWDRHAGTYRTDIRGEYELLNALSAALSLSDDESWGHLWRLDVAKSFTDGWAGDEVTLSIGTVHDVPPEAVLLLVDRDLERAIDLRESPQYTFFLGKRDMVSHEADARFMLLVGDPSFMSAHRDKLPGLPEQNALHQNEPNPFNVTTLIRYDLAEPGYVDIRLYDVHGALVRVLEGENRPAGRYEVGWDGRNERGETVAAGVYFYRLQEHGFTQIRKMILLK